MIHWIKAETIKYYRQETLAERASRMLLGAEYSVIAISGYLLVSVVINAIFYPDLHLAVDWYSFIIHWVEFGIAMTLAGAIVGWFTENYEGIVWGGVLLVVLLLLGNLVASLIGKGSATLVGQSIITAIPLIGIGILLAWAIRAAINRHLYAKQQGKPEIRWKLLKQLIILVILVGSIPGVLSLFGTSSVYTLRSLNTNIQNYSTDPLIESRFPYEKVPGLKDHFGLRYSLYVRPSTIMVGSMDITIRFTDGYAITYLVPQLNKNEQIVLDSCDEGRKIYSP
jgi:hypothetical protein